jgi:hypothetical protein
VQLLLKQKAVMIEMSTLSLNNIVNYTVQVSPAAAVRNAFDLGLIIGDSAVISTSDRVNVYTDLASMLEDGFADDDPEYLAAVLYFSQQPRPKRVAIGRWDTTGEPPAETAVEALNACRLANREWCTVAICGLEKADVLLVAAAVEPMIPTAIYFYTTADADVPAGTEGNVFLSLQALSYQRSIGQYDPNQDDAVAAVMGYAMGANTGLANSAYTLANKSLVGISPVDVTQSQYENILNAGGNVYANFGATYNMFEQGKVANGYPFDEVLNLDKLANDVQLAAIDALRVGPKIPQTEAGMTAYMNRLKSPLEQAKNIGFIASGRWTGPDILGLAYGDVLPNGYDILAESITSQSDADRQARKSPPIYIPIKLAGAIERAVIQVFVNQ